MNRDPCMDVAPVVPGASPAHGISRRRFLAATAAAGGGLLVGVCVPLAPGRAEAAGAAAFTPNAFIRIGADGTIVLTMPYVEMGQGTYTAIPMLIAEELEVAVLPLERVEHAGSESRPRATRTRSAGRGSRCGEPAPRPASCS
jgi:CO/xanthine dehydrogenase Mo-binding subunit